MSFDRGYIPPLFTRRIENGVIMEIRQVTPMMSHMIFTDDNGRRLTVHDLGGVTCWGFTQHRNCEWTHQPSSIDHFDMNMPAWELRRSSTVIARFGTSLFRRQPHDSSRLFVVVIRCTQFNGWLTMLRARTWFLIPALGRPHATESLVRGELGQMLALIVRSQPSKVGFFRPTMTIEMSSDWNMEAPTRARPRHAGWILNEIPPRLCWIRRTSRQIPPCVSVTRTREVATSNHQLHPSPRSRPNPIIPRPQHLSVLSSKGFITK